MRIIDHTVAGRLKFFLVSFTCVKQFFAFYRLSQKDSFSNKNKRKPYVHKGLRSISIIDCFLLVNFGKKRRNVRIFQVKRLTSCYPRKLNAT